MKAVKAHDRYNDTMHTSTSHPPANHRKPLLTQVMQGLVLGTVFAVPVAFWAYNAAQPLSDGSPPAGSKVVARRAQAAPSRKAMRVSAGTEARTIPASRMRVRIDDGSGDN